MSKPTGQKGMSKGDRAMVDHQRLSGIATELLRHGELLLDIREALAAISSLVLADEETLQSVRKRMEEDNERVSD